ncbi:hypothetical protein BS78_08G148400, partial [Paspalum vaginatum]
MSLLEFKKAITHDPQHALISWNDSNHFCSWQGVRCRINNPRRVTSLDLSSQDLVGQISPSLGNLTFLEHIILVQNRFNGEIPSSLGQLYHLKSLHLSENMLQGTIPSFRNCSILKGLWLDRNNLVGQFPAELPHRLQRLQISYNNITGFIPPSLANITTLSMLSCVTNIIQGNIPSEFAKLPDLRLLYVAGNNFTGGFPEAVLNLSTLVHLNIALSNLRGEIPSSIGNSLPNLTVLQLGSNFFHGNIPSSTINASRLYWLDLSGNNFTGIVPRSIGKVARLSQLNLESNNLKAYDEQDWEFMNSLSNCTELQYLALDSNLLEGKAPDSLGNLSVQLQGLYLGQNKLSGGFPFGIENFQNLITLGLDNNRFTGVIPEWIGTLKMLQAVDLNNNFFTGFVPSSLSNLSQLEYLYLSSNQFDGYLSPNLGSLQMLGTLNISDNNIQGRIPKEIFDIPTIMQIDLSFNNLDGKIPTEVGSAKQLIYLRLSSNKLSGDVPNTLGSCESLGFLELDLNFFIGNIPTSLGNLSSLNYLNMSHNNLSGSIPLSLCNLQLLQQLDLSFNRLIGEVPTEGIFKNATVVRIYGNHELCGGVPELHLLACPTVPLNSTKHRQSIVLKVMIPLAICLLSLATVISIILIQRGQHKRKYTFLPSLGCTFPKVSYNDLARATDGFSASKLVGKGRYSSVYQGELFQDRKTVAIKVFSLVTRGAHKTFIAECNALRNVRHRNLVPIITACSSADSMGNDFKALVYEFMPRGDLNALLHLTRDDGNSSTLSCITLAQRLSIMMDVADALEYLHHSNQGSIVHCDLKPSNILLDDNMTAHIGDFGLARFTFYSAALSLGESISTSSVAIKRTIGYVAPECGTGGNMSTLGDVYSFGIVLFEMFLRMRPTDDKFNDGLTIAKFVEKNFPHMISQIVDPELLKEHCCLSQKTSASTKEKSLDCLLSVLNIGLHCTKLFPNQRMCMQEVAARLHGIKDAYISQ